jgi:hypothetical protein
MALGGGGGGGGGRGIRAGAAYVELGVKDSLTKRLKDISSRFMEFGKNVVGSIPFIGGAIGGLLGGFGFKETIDDLAKMQSAIKAMGMSSTGGSGLFGVLNQFSDIGENVEGLTQFSQKVQDALTGVGGASGEAAKLFDGLSVSAQDLANMPLDEKFLAIHEAIRKLPQDQQQFKLSMLGGTDSMKKWLPLLSMSNAELREQAKNLAFGNDELNDAAAASKAMAAAQGQLNRVWQQGVIALAPLAADAAKGLAEAMKPMAEWMKGRNLGMITDEIAARFNLAWEEVKLGGQGVWIDFVASAKTGLLEAGEFVNDLFTTKFWSGMTVGFAAQMNAIGQMFETSIRGMVVGAVGKFAELGKAMMNPLKAAEIGAGIMAAPLVAPLLAEAEIKKAMAGADAEVKKAMAQLVADLAAGKYGAITREGIRAEADAAKLAAGGGVAGARAELNALLARIEAGRKNRRGDDLMGMEIDLSPAAKKMSQLANSIGTFGAGSFLSQGYGVRSADSPGKSMVEQQKKTIVKLGELIEVAKQIKIPRITFN